MWPEYQGPNDLNSMVVVDIRAGSSGKPNTTAERQAWKAFFDHYAFRTRGHPLAHLPPEQHGALGPLLPDNYTRIRAYILRALREGQS